VAVGSFSTYSGSQLDQGVTSEVNCPVLEHGPRSVTSSRVEECKTLRRRESIGMYGVLPLPIRSHPRLAEGWEKEVVRYDPKEGELFLYRSKPEEILVEDRSR
jgi:hypothetical protein